jgi:hypothetical protein
LELFRLCPSLPQTPHRSEFGAKKKKKDTLGFLEGVSLLSWLSVGDTGDAGVVDINK